LIADLDLRVHPEGGYYKELHRSALTVERQDGARRPALTTIYFLMVAGETSHWHRVAADEIWHFYEGDPLELAVASPDATRISAARLGPLAADGAPVRIVPAGWWQSARSLGTFTLVGCSVGPGFEFADFTLLRDLGSADAALRDRLLAYEPDSRRG